MRFLGLDLGKRRTGVAFADSNLQIVMALSTIHHTTPEELIEALKQIVKERKIDTIAVGLPLLLDGSEGEQALYVRKVASMITQSLHRDVEYIDERYSSVGTTKENADTKAACSIVEIAMNHMQNVASNTVKKIE